jgi:hypothetical protein
MYVIGKEEARKFAEKNCPYFLSFIENGRRYNDNDLPRIKDAFEVEECTELVDVYHFSQYRNAGDPTQYWQFDGREWAVRLIGTNMIARPYKSSYSSKTYGLSLMYEDQQKGSFKDFIFDAVNPNFVSKGSRVKMLAWFNYLKMENDAKIDYVKTAYSRNYEFKEKVLSKYPDARMTVLGDGWMSECEFSVGYVLVRFEAGDDGRFYRSTKVDIVRFPSTEELFKTEG